MYYTKFIKIFHLFSNFEFFQNFSVKSQIFFHIYIVPIMYEWGEVKKVLGNKTGFTSYPWTVCPSSLYFQLAVLFYILALRTDSTFWLSVKQSFQRFYRRRWLGNNNKKLFFFLSLFQSSGFCKKTEFITLFSFMYLMDSN